MSCRPGPEAGIDDVGILKEVFAVWVEEEDEDIEEEGGGEEEEARIAIAAALGWFEEDDGLLFAPVGLLLLLFTLELLMLEFISFCGTTVPIGIIDP